VPLKFTFIVFSVKQEDDEFVLQIAFCFARLLSHSDLTPLIAKQHPQMLEYLINMSHDKNQQLCAICDQALQLVSVSQTSIQRTTFSFPGNR
jgi:hypothetical protein